MIRFSDIIYSSIDWNDFEEVDDDNISDEGQIHKKGISKKLSALVNYIEPIKFFKFEDLVDFDDDKKGKFYQMSSLGELKATAILLHPLAAKNLVKYNSEQMSRIYPGAMRPNSSNLSPTLAWNAGCQMGTYNFDIHRRYFHSYNRITRILSSQIIFYILGCI